MGRTKPARPVTVVERLQRLHPLQRWSGIIAVSTLSAVAGGWFGRRAVGWRLDPQQAGVAVGVVAGALIGWSCTWLVLAVTDPARQQRCWWIPALIGVAAVLGLFTAREPWCTALPDAPCAEGAFGADRPVPFGQEAGTIAVLLCLTLAGAGALIAWNLKYRRVWVRRSDGRRLG